MCRQRRQTSWSECAGRTGLGPARWELDPPGAAATPPTTPHTEWPCLGWPGPAAQAMAVRVPAARMCQSRWQARNTPFLAPRLPLCSQMEVGGCRPGNWPLFPPKQSLDVKIRGSSGLGFWPERVPHHPGWQRGPVSAASPACSELVWPRQWGGRVTPLQLECGGGSSGGGGTFPAVAAAGHHPPPALLPQSRRLQLVWVALVPGGCYFGGVGAKEPGAPPPPGAGSGAAPAAVSRWPTWPGGHRTGSVPNARPCGPLNLGPGGEAACREGAGPAVAGLESSRRPQLGEERPPWREGSDFG